MSAKNHHLIEGLSGTDHREIRAFAHQRVGLQDAEDVIQDAYLHLLQRSQNEVVREPRALLFKVVANLSIDAWRKSKRMNQSSSEIDDIELDALVSHHPGPEALTASSVEFESFLSALDELPDLQRHAFVLNKFEALTHSQIAERLGVSTKSVQRYLVTAMEHFASRLDGY